MQYNFSFPMHSWFQYTEYSYDGLLSVSPKIVRAGCWPGGDLNTGQGGVVREVEISFIPARYMLVFIFQNGSSLLHVLHLIKML